MKVMVNLINIPHWLKTNLINCKLIQLIPIAYYPFLLLSTLHFLAKILVPWVMFWALRAFESRIELHLIEYDHWKNSFPWAQYFFSLCEKWHLSNNLYNPRKRGEFWKRRNTIIFSVRPYVCGQVQTFDQQIFFDDDTFSNKSCEEFVHLAYSSNC